MASSPAERFDPEGGNNPKGEWRPEKRLIGRGSKQATGRSKETAGGGANRNRQWSRRPNELVSDRAGREVAGQERRSWNGLGESRGCSRGAKGRHERPVLFWRETAARQDALILGAEKKTPPGEQRGKSAQRSGTRSSVPGMPAESEAGNQVTWNHFFLGRPWQETAPFGRGSVTHHGVTCSQVVAEP